MLYTKASATLAAVRMTGQTTSCIGVLFQNQNAKMVVERQSHADQLARQYPGLSRSRFVTVEQLEQGDVLRGWNGLLVYDTPAVMAIAERGYRQGKEETQRMVDDNVVSIGMFGDIKALENLKRLLAHVGKLLDATVYVVSNKK